MGLNAGKWAQKGGLKVALKRLLGGSKVHLNPQSLLQSPVVLQSRCLDSGPGLVQSRCLDSRETNRARRLRPRRQIPAIQGRNYRRDPEEGRPANAGG